MMLFVPEESKEAFLSYSSDLELVNCNESIQYAFATSVNNLIMRSISHEVGNKTYRQKYQRKHSR